MQEATVSFHLNHCDLTNPQPVNDALDLISEHNAAVLISHGHTGYFFLCFPSFENNIMQE